MTSETFLDLPQSSVENADFLLLPLPFEKTVSFGAGTAQGPQAIWNASTQIELWDEELDFDLETLRIHSASPLIYSEHNSVERYLQMVEDSARKLNQSPGLLFGVGGEHSLTPPLVAACFDNHDDYSDLTVVQFDAHADLRESYEGMPHSHACAMRRLVERGANVIAIGIRSADREEFKYSQTTNRVNTFFAQQLATNSEIQNELTQVLKSLSGNVYLTFDIDALEVSLCPGTGTPQPGGLTWWPTLSCLRALLHNPQINLLGCDVVEVAPVTGTHVNEFVAAKLIAKIMAYWATNPSH